MYLNKYRAPRGYGWLTNPKKAAYNRVYNRTTKKACYIATAVYGHEDAWQVEKLRQYRDNALRKHVMGRVFITCYYLISPHLISLLNDVKPVRFLTRSLLDRFINKL